MGLKAAKVLMLLAALWGGLLLFLRVIAPVVLAALTAKRCRTALRPQARALLLIGLLNADLTYTSPPPSRTSPPASHPVG